MGRRKMNKLAVVKDFWTKDQKERLAEFRKQLLTQDGRPRSEATLYAQAVRSYMASEITLNIKPIMEAMMNEVYKGNVMAFIALTDRAFGKPTQAVEMSGKDGQPIVFMPLELMNKYALETTQEPLDVNKDLKVVEALPHNGLTEPLSN